MYMHYCKRCQRVHMLNGHKQFCPKCRGTISELKISFLDYVSMNQTQRTAFYACCADDEQLKRLSTTYRMYKYSKWYKERQLQLQISPTLLCGYVTPDGNPVASAVSLM